MRAVLALAFALGVVPTTAGAEPIEFKVLTNGIQIPQLLFLKVANDIQMAVDLVFVRQ